ncbi:MAG TPA: tail fiber domain-containing protein [Pyrinomonadaceae bacterium]|nr:tail fiber domain-containing protein [Pyrinomonadaceae bacterium]
MLKARRFIATILLTAIFTSYAGAQSALMQQQEKEAAPAVTASASGAGARYTAPGEVLQIRLEIFSATGEVVFDSGQRGGGVIDWNVADVQQGMAEGSYISVVTVRDLRGKLSQRLGSVTLQGGNVTLGRAADGELSAAQAQAVSAARQSRKIETPVSDDSSVTILRDGKERAVTVTTHDGQNGQVTSTAGALTLSTGDVLTGKDKEHVRITPEGQVGIGTDKPEATLDVAGTIRARGGIRFDDGTLLTSAAGTGSTKQLYSSAVAPGGAPVTNATGTGTTNRLAKWVDSTGTLSDSIVTETSGNLGIGTATPQDKLHLNGGGIRVEGSGSQFLAIAPSSAPSVVNGVDLRSGTGGDVRIGSFNDTNAFGGAAFQLFSDSNPVLSGQIYFDTGNNAKSAHVFRTGYGSTEAMRIVRSGFIGIGTATPTQRLEVTGNLKISGAGSSLIFPDGTTQTTAGGSMTGSQILTAINNPATAGTINDNRLSGNVGRLSGANAWSGSNVFSTGLSANNALITNVANPVNAGDAVNKAYIDGNFVKFVPGAEQLSVGDANGTAPMINLRGGSTCCSGPGGHTPAFFKVFQNGSFVATGNLGIGTSPMEGKGYRTSWHTYKGAFRSGYADNEWDDANVGFFSWAGGSNSTASGLYALAFGDTNYARSTSSIAFGSGNEVKGAAGFSAGAGNRVCDTYGVALGNNARSGGPYIDGKCDPETFNIRGLAAVAIGYNVTADQDHTTAMGKFASNNGFQGTFIWSDGAAQASADTFRNTANNEFAARATGGFRFRTNLGGTTGCNLPAGSGVFNCTSSRTTKENFRAVDGDDVLARLRKVPVSSWNYINEGNQVRHLGPMAEDFYQAFGLGIDNKSIGVQDLAGVSLVAVKALEERAAKLQESNAKLSAGLEQKTTEVEQLRSELNSLRATTSALAQRLDALEQGKETKAVSSETKPSN